MNLRNILALVAVSATVFLGGGGKAYSASVDLLVTNLAHDGEEGVRSYAFADDSVLTEGAPSCKKLMLVLAKKMMPILRKCSSDLKSKFASDKVEFGKRQMCPMKCFMVKSKMADSTGQVSNATVTEFFKEYLPTNYYELGYQVTGPCVTEYDGKLDNQDEYCRGYGDFLKCMQIKAVDHCMK